MLGAVFNICSVIVTVAVNNNNVVHTCLTNKNYIIIINIDPPWIM